MIDSDLNFKEESLICQNINQLVLNLLTLQEYGNFMKLDCSC